MKRYAYARVSSKGQLVIPQDLRNELGLALGTKVFLEREGNSIILRPLTPEFFRSVRGSTKDAGAERESMHRDDKPR